MSEPDRQDIEGLRERLIALKNEISASIYGEYYYELPEKNGGRELVDRIMEKIEPVISEHTAEARKTHRKDLEHFLSEWATFTLPDGTKAIRLEHIQHRLKQFNSKEKEEQ